MVNYIKNLNIFFVQMSLIYRIWSGIAYCYKVFIIMSEDDKLHKFFRAYLTDAKIKQDFAEKILKHAEQFDSKHRAKQFLSRLFDCLKKAYDPKSPKNFITCCKRFLFIIHKLLGAEVRKDKQGNYNQTISEQIVRYYLFIFEIIFKHSLHQLIVDLKMYRMKWAKLITDHSFISLRQLSLTTVGKKSQKFREQIKKKHNNFNLDRGFSQENMEKLKKIHQKRGLTPKQSNFYLGLEEKQPAKQSTVEDKQDPSSSSQSQQSRNQDQMRQKKLKTQYSYQNPPQYGFPEFQNFGGQNYRIYYSGYAPQYPYQGEHSQRIQDPRTRYGFNQPIYQKNTYPSAANTYQTGNKPLELVPQPNLGSYYTTSPDNLSSFDNPAYSNTLGLSKPHIQFEYKEVPEQTKNQRNYTSVQKIFKMRKELYQNLLKCRQCGQSFQTGENHQKHLHDHFFASLQKVNETELKGKIKKQNKIKLLDLKNWQFAQKPVEKEEHVCEVLVSELPDQKGQKVYCYFCNEQLQIAFSTKYEDWVLRDAIKIDDQGKVDVIHFGCYDSFKSDQNSSVLS